MPDSRKIYFITGANKPNGIGFRLVEKLVARPDTLVFATARNPTSATELQALAGKQDNLVLLQLEATSEEDARAAAEAVEQKAGKIDVVIANSGALPLQPITALGMTDMPSTRPGRLL